jgi:hypothetical protein
MANPRRTFPPGPGDSHDDEAWLGGEVADDWLEARQESEGNMATENDEPDDPDAATDNDPRDPDWWKGRQNYGTAGDSKESEEEMTITVPGFAIVDGKNLALRLLYDTEKGAQEQLKYSQSHGFWPTGKVRPAKLVVEIEEGEADVND